MASSIVLCESAGTGSDGQFAPIKLSCEESCEGLVLSSSFLGEVEPSMTAVWFAARRVKLKPPPVASVEEGGSTVQQKSENYKIRQPAVKTTKRLELVDTPAKLTKKHSK